MKHEDDVVVAVSHGLAAEGVVCIAKRIGIYGLLWLGLGDEVVCGKFHRLLCENKYHRIFMPHSLEMAEC